MKFLAAYTFSRVALEMVASFDIDLNHYMLCQSSTVPPHHHTTIWASANREHFARYGQLLLYLLQRAPEIVSFANCGRVGRHLHIATLVNAHLRVSFDRKVRLRFYLLLRTIRLSNWLESVWLYGNLLNGGILNLPLWQLWLWRYDLSLINCFWLLKDDLMLPVVDIKWRVGMWLKNL
jgi:hypothetical protein